MMTTPPSSSPTPAKDQGLVFLCARFFDMVGTVTVKGEFVPVLQK